MPLEPPGPACSGLGVLSRFCDLFGIDEGSKQLVTLYGRKDRTFDIYYSPVSISGTLGSQSECCAATLAMADFNAGRLLHNASSPRRGRRQHLRHSCPHGTLG